MRVRPEASRMRETLKGEASPQWRHCAMDAPSASISRRNVFEWHWEHMNFMGAFPQGL
jgi:hypothetical protein